MELSLLEQSTLAEGRSASDAIANTVAVAREADELGYSRIWLSEHHNMQILQGSAPEVLLGAIGAQTNRIRIGSGGVMLPNHSAYRVAENFRMLEALFPGRVDCGIGRASGGDAYSRALLNPAPETHGDFASQVHQLDRYFHDECRRALAMPLVANAPPLWLLSSASHAGSAMLAAETGMGLAVALFINPRGTPDAVREYRKRFRASEEFPEPKVILALNVVCAATPERLDAMRKTSDYFRLMRDSGNYPNVLPAPETLAQIHYGQEERDYLEQISNREVVGLPRDVRDQLLERASAYDADEIMITSMSYSLDDKLEMIRLLAEAFHL